MNKLSRQSEKFRTALISKEPHVCTFTHWIWVQAVYVNCGAYVLDPSWVNGNGDTDNRHSLIQKCLFRCIFQCMHLLLNTRSLLPSLSNYNTTFTQTYTPVIHEDCGLESMYGKSSIHFPDN